MSQDLFQVEGRTNAYKFNPLTQLCIITKTEHRHSGPKDRVDPNHPACEKIERAITEEDIADMDRRGMIEPIRVLRDGNKLGIVVVGRRRTRIARIINERRAEANKDLPKDQRKPLMVVEALPVRTADALVIRGMMLSENMRRANYTASQIGAQLAEFITMGGSEEECAELAGQKTAWVKNHLAINDTCTEVQKAVDAGEISVMAAAELATLTREEQKAKLAELTAGGGKATVKKVRAATRAARGGKAAVEGVSKRTLRRQVALITEGKGHASGAPATLTVFKDALLYVLEGKLPSYITLPQ